MYIRDFHVTNYVIHQDTTIQLLPLTVFVGANGSGKSAFFDAMLNFSMLSRGNLRAAFGQYPFSFKATLWKGANKNVARIGYKVSMSQNEQDANWLEYEIDYAQTGKDEDEPQFTIFKECLTKKPCDEILFDRSNPDKFTLCKNINLDIDRSIFSALRQQQVATMDDADNNKLAYCLTQQISRVNKFRLDSYTLAQPSRIPDISQATVTTTPRIGYHGEDLAATLYYLSETNSPEIERIQDRIKEIDDKFQQFEFNTVGTDRIAFSAVYSDSRKVVPSARLSSGMLNYIGLVVLVSIQNRPPVLMIEEPENGLTPQAIRAFYKAVRSLAHNENPEHRSQVLISSHSPFLICEAWNEEDSDCIYHMKVEGGKTVVRKLSEIVTKHQLQLAKDNSGKRSRLSLGSAEELMSGYLS